MQIPTADAVTRLQSLFPNNPRLNLYLGALGSLRGTGAPFNVALGVDPQTGVDRGTYNLQPGRMHFRRRTTARSGWGESDHYQSEAHRLSLRFSYDSLLTSLPVDRPAVSSAFPVSSSEQAFTHDNFVFTDSYTFGPSYTNEFRFSYERPDAELRTLAGLGSGWPRPCRESRLPAVAAPGLNNAASSTMATTSCSRRRKPS